MKKLLTTVLSLLFVISLFSQNSQNGIWRSAKEVAFAKKNAERRIVPDKYKTFSLDLSALSEILKEAPLRFTEGAKSKAPTLPVPLPTGLFQDFEIMEAPVMHPGLAAKYPGMKSYAGWSKEDPTAYFRFGVTQKGFHGIILSARHSTVYIDAYAVGDTEHYVCYFKKDYSKKQDFECLVDAPPFPKNIVQPADKNLAGDCMHRTFELALACTGEYAQFHGGTVASVMAEYNVAITRVNSIYERDANLTLELIANTDQLIFLNAATDPYTNNNGSTMLGQNQTTVGNIIGNANYDIGHVFSTGGGGIAQLNSVCSNNRKAMGVTGLTNPVGDPFYVDYVCHEMGHQFGGNHTQNNPCNRNNATAMEPGSANTIMGYAGICAPNSQNFSDDHFHAVSLAEIAAHVTGSGGSCADLSPNGNNAPSVAVPATSYNLPISTPFALTAEGTDPDGDNMLTYCWEQMDNQVANMPPETTNTGGPAFRSFPPVESPTRYFPRLSAIVNNSSPTWEVLPSVSRMMNFRCTVRDNNPGGGCTDEADVDLQFSNNAGPFLVSAPNTAAVVWTTAGMEDVNWDVANTDAAPINAANVDIYLSIDGGLTYPFLLSENTPNDGSEQVLVPIQETTQARVMVKANGNIFFDISNENFSIEMPAVPTFVLSPNPALQMACQSGEADFGFDLQALSGFNEMITFTATDVPAGATVSFDANPSAPSGTVTMTVDGLENLSPGTYTIQVEGTSTTISQNTQVELVILDLVSGTPTNTDPLDGSSGVAPTGGVLTWAQVPFATGYYVELSDSPGFQTLLSQDTVTENSFDLPVLMETQVYYWRIRGFNMCSEGPLSEFFAFQTGAPACVEYASENVPVPISPNQAVTVTSTIEVPVNKAVSSIALSMDASHSWVGDLLATLTSPGGTEVLLFDQPGVPAEQYGCGNDNMEVSFSDSAANTADDLENTCNPSPLAIDGDFQAIEPLSNFIGENGLGTWTLSISDLVAQDGGSLDGWTLEVCSAESFEPAVLINNNVFTVPQGMSGTITNSFLEAEGMGSTGKFTLLSEPQNGTLYLQGAALQLGSSFTQTDIDMGNLSYTHDGSMVLTDSFLFDVTDEQSKWLHGQVFQIQIIENSLAASVVLSQNIDCNNANNGIITATPTGGNAPFEYSLNGGAFQSSNVFENLAAGTYTVTVMDNTGFTANTNTVEITNPSPIVLSADVVADVITANANGGTGTLQYSIDGIVFQNSNVFPGLSNNSYTVTVMDENGCLETVNAIVAVNTMIVSATVSEGISCFGESDGTVTVNAGGGMEPYAYSLNGGAFQADNVFSNLGEGIYEITVRDAEGFEQTIMQTINQPPPLTADPMVDGYQISIAANGGTGTLQFSLDGGPFQSSNVFFPLPNGTYGIVVTDENGCETSLGAEVNVAVLSVGASVSQTPSCFDSADGALTATGAGGVPPFEYSLNNGPFQSSNVFENLPAGDYTVTIRDSGGFTQVSANTSLVAPAEIEADATTDLGEITISAHGGTAPFLYQLDGGAFQMPNVFTNVADGEHTLTVQDANGCETSIQVDVSSTLPVSGTAEIGQPISCSGEADGSLVISAAGGVPPYQYSLDGIVFQAGNTFPGLPAGNYEPSVQDAAGEVFVLPGITISDPMELVANGTVFGTQITVDATGGTGTLAYSLNGGAFQNQNVFTAPSNGDYTITVMDENGCTQIVEVAVNIIESVVISGQQISCNGSMDGEISIGEVAGGFPPYTYSVNNSPFSSQTIYPDLEEGQYSIVIMDATGYQWTTPPINITNPAPVSFTTDLNGNDLTINAVGGTGNLLYSIDGGATFSNENIFTDLPDGGYDIVVTDGNGCSATMELTAVNEVDGGLVFEVLPNPSPAIFILKMETPINGELYFKIYDVTGKLIHQSKSNSTGRTTETFDLGNMPNGNYQLHVTNGELWGVKRLVVLRR